MSEKNKEIESKVPGEQQLREASSDSTENEPNTSDNKNEIAIKDDSVYSPVIKITKQETTLTKGELKLQKVIVSEDISDKTTVNRTIRMMESVGPDEVHSEIRSKVVITTRTEESERNGVNEGIKTEDNDNKDSKISTRIPKFKLRRALDKIKREEQLSREKIVHEPFLGVKVRSSIPRLKDAKQQSIQTDLNEKKDECPLEESPKLDEEFDKIYEETVGKDASNNNIPTPEKIDNLSKVDTKFEEIIHAYDDGKVQPIVTDKVKSKIPLLKRKSEQEIIVQPQMNRRSSLKKSLSVEETKGKIPVKKEKNMNNDLDRTKITGNKATSESHAELKSETLSAEKFEASERITTSMIKTVTNQESIMEQVNISSTEDLEVRQGKDIDRAGFKDVSKCRIPVALHAKERVETQSVTSGKSTQQITTGTTKTFIGNNNTDYVEGQYSVKRNGTQSEVNSTQKLNSKIVTSNEKKSSDTSENTDSLMVDSTKVTEISKTNVEVENYVTNEIKETVKVATLHYDGSHDFGSKSILENNKTTASNNVEQINVSSGVTATDNKTFATEKFETQNNFNSSSLGATKILKDTREYKNKSEKQNETENTDITNMKAEHENSNTLTSSIFNKVNSGSYNYSQRDSKSSAVTSVKSELSSEHNIKREIMSQETSKAAILIQNLTRKRDVTDNEENGYSNKGLLMFKEKEEREKITDNKYSNNERDFERNEINNKFINNAIENEANDKDSRFVANTLSHQISNMDDLEEEEIIILKGKVNRIINRLDSREQQVNKTDIDDVPSVSVSSKIAIFENPNSINENNKHNLKPSDVEGTKPKIVDELLKTRENVLDINHNEDKINMSKNESGYDTKDKKNDAKDSPFKFEKLESLEDKFFDKNNQFQSDYYRVYNRVHSSVVERLNSIEMNLKTEANEKTEFHNEIDVSVNENKIETSNNLKETISKIEPNMFDNEVTNSNENNDVFNKEKISKVDIFKEYRLQKDLDSERRAKSLAELDLGDAVRGRVKQMVFRLNSMEKMRLMRSDTLDKRDKLRNASITSRVALFEKKVVPTRTEDAIRIEQRNGTNEQKPISEADQALIREKIAELTNAKIKYGKFENMTSIELMDGSTMPVIALGTALLDRHLTKHIVSAAIDLGYRAIDTAFIYGNEKQIGEAIKEKIDDGTVKREELYIMSKLWSTFHRRELVEKACKQSLKTMGLDYFDLYMIHNPMSFKEGAHPLPKIANVLQYSEHDYLEAWYGIEDLVRKGLVKRGGISNFNSVQVERVVDKGKIKPVVNQVECHPYLTQQRLDEFCATRNIKLNCFGVLGSKGTPLELKSGLPPAIDDPLVKVMSAGLGVTPAQLLIAYQIQAGRSVVVKSSSAGHLWDNLQALNIILDQSEISALNALNRNKRTFTFAGMGDTHRNYPFKIAF